VCQPDAQISAVESSAPTHCKLELRLEHCSVVEQPGKQILSPSPFVSQAFGTPQGLVPQSRLVWQAFVQNVLLLQLPLRQSLLTSQA
jgi:hypothetical protein